jgi:hypothetical protein
MKGPKSSVWLHPRKELIRLVQRVRIIIVDDLVNLVAHESIHAICWQEWFDKTSCLFRYLRGKRREP